VKQKRDPARSRYPIPYENANIVFEVLSDPNENVILVLTILLLSGVRVTVGNLRNDQLIDVNHLSVILTIANSIKSDNS